jgi:leader peptidase (prepilin peptidase)/N-methyltransferase
VPDPAEPAASAVLAVVAALGGALVVGPALNRAILAWVGEHVVVPAVLCRPLAAGEVARAPARCHRCGAELGVTAGPVVFLPWLAAAGRCRACGAARPAWWLAVEAITAAAFAVTAARFGWSAELPAVLALAAGLVAMSAVDAVYLRIPTRFVYVTGAAVVAGGAWATAVDTPPGALVGAAAGAAIYGAFLGLFWLVWPAGLGFGDVRMGTLVGLVVGWLAWDPRWPVYAPLSGIVQAAFAAGLVGVLVGIVLLMVRRQNRPFAFGPSLALGGLVTILWLGPLP